MADVLDSPEAGPAAVRGGALRAVGYGATVILSIGSAALLFRHLGVDDSGRYVTAMSIVAVVAGLTDAGLTAIGIREIAAQGAVPGSKLLRELLGMRLALTALGVVAAVGFTAATGYGPTLELGVALLGFALLLQNVQLTLSIPLQVELRFAAVVAADVVRQAVLVISIVALVLAGAGLLPLLAASIPAALAALLLTALLLRRSVPMRPAFTFVAWRSLLREALPYAVTGAIISVYFRVAIVIVSLVATERETGIFSASFRIIDVLVVVPQLVIGAAFPIFAHAAADNHERLGYGFQRVFDIALILGVWMAVTIAVAAGFAIAVVAGPQFAPAADVLRIQGIAMIGSFIASATGYVLL
ncbi:MAG TPA: oligosaccharide flippase family protein, partial [Thermoleophilaceae bacterium]